MAFKGADKHRARLRRMASPRARALVKDVVYAAADICAAEAAVSITSGSAGGQHGGKHQHVPSSPNQPPNAETGHLNESIHVEPIDGLSARVVADASYAAALEFGTSKMVERPFMRPAAQKTKPKMLKLLRAVARDLTRG